MKLQYRHNTGCRKIAFYIESDHRPVSGELVIPSEITLLDGTKPDPNTEVLCGSCGGWFLQLIPDDLEEVGD